MFIIRLTKFKVKGKLFSQTGNEFIIEELDFTLKDPMYKQKAYYEMGNSINDVWFCETRLGNYPVDKYRMVLKQKFNAVKYKKPTKGPIFYDLGHIKPMVFESREDAERALEWVQSIQLSAKLNS